MSTYYFLVCDDCERIADAASHSAGAKGPYGDYDKELFDFIINHHGHSVRIINEHEEQNQPFKSYAHEFTGLVGDEHYARMDELEPDG